MSNPNEIVNKVGTPDEISRRRHVKDVNRESEDAKYDRQVAKIDRIRQQQEENLQRRLAQQGNAPGRIHQQELVRADLRGCSDAKKKSDEVMAERERKEDEQRQKYQQQLAQEEQKKRELALSRSQSYDQENKNLYMNEKQRKIEEQQKNSDPIISDAFFDNFGKNFR